MNLINMFEFKGKQYTLEQLQNIAEQKGYTFDELLNKNPEIKDLGKITPTTPGAVVEETAAPELTLTESPSVNTSLDLPKDKPNILQSLAAKTARGFASTFKGLQAVPENIMFGLGSIGMNTQDKKAFRKALSMGIPGSNVMTTGQYDNLIDDINNYVRKTENESVTEAISKGNIAEAVELTVGGALESAPSILAAMTGYGGIALFGSSVAGNKFDEEFNKNPERSTALLAANAIGSGAIEATFELATRGLLKQFGIVQAKSGKEAAKKLLEEGVSSFLKKTGIAYTKEAGSEAATELTQILFDKATLGGDVDLGEAFTRVADAGIIGGFMGGTISTVAQIGDTNTGARNRAEYILTPESKKQKMQESAAKISNLAVDLEAAEGDAAEIIKKEILKEESNIINIKKQNSLNLKSLNKDQLKQYASNIDKINKNKNISGPESAIELAKIEINNLTKQNNEIIDLAKSQKLQKSTEFAKKVGAKIGKNVRALNNEQIISEFGKEVEGADGFVKGNEIIINKDIAKETGAVTVGSHEVLHPILESALKGKDQQKIINDFKKIIGTEQLNIVEERLQKSYDADYISKNQDEYFTVFSDAILKGEIKYNDNIFTKLGDLIRPILRKVGFSKIKFETGKDVYNFLKEYNKSVAKGDVAQEIIDIAKETEQEIKTSRTGDNIQKIFDEKGKDGAFDIIEAYKPLTTKLTNKYRDVPGFDFELLQSEIEIGKRGLLDLINAYDPSKGATLNTYIQGQLTNRSIEAANRILDTEFKLDVTEAKGVTDTATAEETIEAAEEAKFGDEIKSLRKEIGLSEGLVNTVKDAVIKTFGTKLPNPQDPKFRLELQKRFRTELKKPMAKFVGKQADYESFLRDNFQSIYNKLPQSLINRRFKDFAEPVLDENGKQLRERTAEGNKVFTKKKISKAEFIKYFLGSDVGRSTQGTRKTAIVEAVAEEIAFDATMEVLNDPEVIQKYQDIAGITGEILPENFKSLIAKQVDRAEDFKFSKSIVNNAKSEYNLESQELARILDKTSLDKLSNKYSLISDAIIYEADTNNIKFSLTTKADGKWEQNALNPLDESAKLYKFKVGEVDYEINTFKDRYAFNYDIFEQTEGIEDEFVANDLKSWAMAFSDALDGSTDITGVATSGLTNQFKVFGTVANATIDLIKNQKLNSITFSAKEKSRQRLYRSLNEKFAKELGWQTYDFEGVLPDGIETIFIAYNPKAFPIEKQTIEQKETIESEILRNNNNLKFSKTIENVNTKEKVKVKDILGKSFKEYDPMPNKIGSFDDFWKNVKQNIAKNYRTTDGIIKPYDARFYKSIAYEYWTAKKWLITHPQLELISNDFKGFDPTGSGDLTFRDKNNNKTFSVEVKMTEAAIMSTGSLRFENGEIIPSKNPIEIFQYIKNLLVANNFVEGLSEVLSATKRKFIPLYNITDAEKQIIDPIKNKKLNKTIVLNDTSNINNVYSKKKVDYFDIGGYIYTVSTDPMGFNAPKLNGKAIVKARLKYTGKNEKGLRSAFVAVENKLINRGKELKKEIKVNDLKFSKSLNKEFNKLLEQSSGIRATKQFSPIEARILGKGKGRNKFFIPYSADDFVGLLYATLAGGKTGDQQMEWYRENLLRPFSRGIQQYEAAKQNALREWQILKKEAKKNVPGGLTKKNATGLSNQDAVRIYIWNQQGMEIPDTKGSQALINENIKIVKKNKELKAFAEKLMALNPEGYPEPSKNWDSGDITTDLVSYINGVKRSEFLTEWKKNADIIFSDKNKEKLRALYGDRYVEALDDILHRMRTGTNRKFGASRIEKQFMDWTNNSVGAIMFFNARSAVLQTLSAVNFINFTDNNPLNASLALINQKQYWDDFSTLFNSDFLKQRRSGLQTDVNADEIARAAKGAENTARAALSAILKFGFTPTQIADSFAIASGGATFYRNRINKYKKEGLSQQEAEQKAFTDFQEIAEETQQSARPDRISSQQASSLGRLILAFGNTPMQYARLTKKATLDLINGRGDWKTNMSKIMYYSVIQNIIFSALQQGLFALLFDDEDDDKEKSRLFRIGNSSLDTLLRGAGVYGAAAATVKNMILEIIDQQKSGRPDYTEVVISATAISPPINSKLRKLNSAGKTFTYKQSKEKVFTEGFSLENPAFLAGGQIISAATNLPADRVVLKADHLKTAMEPETELWQAIALSLGWSEWDLNMIEKQTKKEFKKFKTFKKFKKFKK